MAKKSEQPLQVISTRTPFHGPVFQVTSDQVVEPGGAVQVRRDTVRHQGSVVIMAIDESGEEPRVLLARQYRYPAKDYLWEFPAGRIDDGESELAAARRELMEETGCTARQWKRALFFYSSPGFLDETMAIYLARDLVQGKAQPEEDEMITTRFFPLSALLQKAVSGKLQDGKTIAGVLWLAQAGWREKTCGAAAKSEL
jgi:ADP-ribose pyrophosphatase